MKKGILLLLFVAAFTGNYAQGDSLKWIRNPGEVFTCLMTPRTILRNYGENWPSHLNQCGRSEIFAPVRAGKTALMMYVPGRNCPEKYEFHYAFDNKAQAFYYKINIYESPCDGRVDVLYRVAEVPAIPEDYRVNVMYVQHLYGSDKQETEIISVR